MKNYDLTHFHKAHQSSYETALGEIKNGRKKSHWMWYIFPQIQGLGITPTAQYYAITDAAEAQAFLNDPILGTHLREISAALLDIESSAALQVMGYPDDLKLRSCMTLFANVCEDNQVFLDVLEKYYEGKQDNLTLEIMKQQKLL